MERLIHNLLKTEINRVAGTVPKADELGMYLTDGMLFTNLDVNLSTEPDGLFVSDTSIEMEGAVITQGNDTIEIIGAADMTLEVISPTSVDKDTVQLRRLYWDAGVREYWLVDSREKTFSFDILRRGSAKFLATRKHQGWQKSQVFGREFKLTRETTKHDVSKFTLEVR